MGDETPADLGKRIAALYKELSYPGVSKFQGALRKGGGRVSDEFVRTLV
jgi:transposase InsO family protein